MKIGLLFVAAIAAAAVPNVPELGQRGSYAVAVRTVDLVHRGQVDVLHFDEATGKAPTYDRALKVEIWYPALRVEGQVEATTYEMPLRDPESGSVKIPGRAIRDAAPLQGTAFPLVILSHGYPGSRIFLSYLGEHLASRGYVVASIDHTDSVLGAIRPFPSTLLNRAADQIFVLGEVARMSFLQGTVDAERAAVIGYSMGGYGALATAGAGYNPKGGTMKIVPGGYLREWSEGNPDYLAKLPKNLKAMVAIAPWGAQPPQDSWDEGGLAGIHVPSLFIAGDHDDVADYDHGIKPAFEGAVHSDRCMVVYANARHNTGGNPPPAGITRGQDIAFFEEPVWDKERLCAINQHFVTAFLDLYLKGDESKRAYLNETWKGFEKRWSLGIGITCVGAK
jgi:predicted dienelactone hydrolase